MNWLDVVIVLVVGGFVLSAYSAGLIREVVTLVATLIGIIIAGALYDDLAADVLVFVDDKEAAQAVSFLVLFGSVYLIGQISAFALKTGAALVMLGWADHLGGAAFGFLKGIIVVQLLLVVFAAYPELGLDGAVDNSLLGRYFVDDISFILRMLPANFDDRIDAFLGE